MKIFAKSMLAKSACALALAASAAMAGESFGGIGVTIYATPDGVRVVDVVPGSPAAEAGLEKDDRIVAVDGVSLAGNDIEESKALLRGTVGKPLEVSVRREKESYSFTLRRAHIAVNEIASADVQEWYDDPSASKAYTPAEISEVARKSLGSNYELLSVMKDGRVIPEDMTVGASELSSVSIEKDIPLFFICCISCPVEHSCFINMPLKVIIQITQKKYDVFKYNHSNIRISKSQYYDKLLLCGKSIHRVNTLPFSR